MSKFEIVSFSEGEDRNQYRMTKILMSETVLGDIRFRERNFMSLFLSLEYYNFEFVSDFDIRPALASGSEGLRLGERDFIGPIYLSL